jgi:hypothetical protein
VKKITQEEYSRLEEIAQKLSELKDEIAERRGVEDITDVEDGDVLWGMDGAWAELSNVMATAEREVKSK